MNIQTNTTHDSTVPSYSAMERSFSFRAECMADAECIRAMLLPWMQSWQAHVEPLEFEGRWYRQPDVEVTFTVSEAAPTLPAIRWLVDGLLNCHIAAETLQLTPQYTGERDSRRAWSGEVERPSQEVLLQASEALQKRQKLLEAELERSRHMYRTLREPHDLGKRWSPPTDGASPGWVAVAELPGTELKRIVRVSAMNRATKPGKSSREVEQRLRVING